MHHPCKNNTSICSLELDTFKKEKHHLLATRNVCISMHFMYAIGLRYRTCLKSFTVYVRLDMTVLGKCKNLHVFQQSHLDGSTLAPFSLKFSSNPIGLLEWEPRLLPTWNFPASVSHIDIIHRLVGLVGLVAHKHHCAWTDQCPICPQSAASVREQGGFGSTTSRYTCTSFDIS